MKKNKEKESHKHHEHNHIHDHAYENIKIAFLLNLLFAVMLYFFINNLVSFKSSI